jgi:hypothetical protein
MALQHAQQRSDSAVPNESHDDIDRICGLNLASKFMANGRLSWSIRQNRCVEERRERPFDSLRISIRERSEHGIQDSWGLDKQLFVETSSSQSVEPVNDLVNDVRPLPGALALRQRVDRVRNQPSNVTRKAIRRLRVRELASLGKQRLIERIDGAGEASSQERFA